MALPGSQARSERLSTIKVAVFDSFIIVFFFTFIYLVIHVTFHFISSSGAKTLQTETFGTLMTNPTTDNFAGEPHTHLLQNPRSVRADEGHSQRLRNRGFAALVLIFAAAASAFVHGDRQLRAAAIFGEDAEERHHLALAAFIRDVLWNTEGEDQRSVLRRSTCEEKNYAMLQGNLFPIASCFASRPQTSGNITRGCTDAG